MIRVVLALGTILMASCTIRSDYRLERNSDCPRMPYDTYCEGRYERSYK